MESQIFPPDNFWQSLLESKLCEKLDVDELKKIVGAQYVQPLGGILVREGFLTVHQLGTILHRQADEPNTKIGRLAIRAGFCTEANVKSAIRIQQSMNPGPVDLLIARTNIDNAELIYKLVKLVHELKSRIESVERTID